VRFQSLRDDAPPTAYLFFEQQPWGGDLALAVRSRTAAEGAVDAVRREIRAFDPAIPVYDVTAMTAVLGNAVARERFSATLMGIFSALALALAGVGVFGVVSYAVSRRVRETGIRIALGARAEDVLRLLVGQSMRPVLIGVAIGLPTALVVATILRSSLYGVGPADPVTFLGVLVVLLGVSFLATWLPARRATRVDPAIALRSD
jgi:ABC-type antimicrobial peptide transport system permease subunit